MRPVLERVFAREELADLDPAARRLALRSVVYEATAAGDGSPTVAELADFIDGFGPLSPLMRADDVTDVVVNGPFEVWVDRGGSLRRTDIAFADPATFRSFIERTLGACGAHVDASRPIADARLADGSRIHVVLPPVAPNGPLLSIRRFPQKRLIVDDLVAAGMLNGSQADALRQLVRERVTIAISGGTGSGKTTLLNALLGLIDSRERVVVVEETPELAPACPHFVSLVAQPPTAEGAGAISLDSLVRTALRMRPDRIVVGEVRGPEALSALAAFSTGHEGSMVTLHARSAEAIVPRMVALALQARAGASEASLRRQFDAAFGARVHLRRVDGRRQLADLIC